jgi:hypothetical protein
VVPPKGERYYKELFAARREGFGSIFNGLERPDQISKEIFAKNFLHEDTCRGDSECWKIAWPGWKELPIGRMENR